MIPLRPFLIRATHEWLTKNNVRPYIQVDINVPGVSAPIQFARNGILTLDIDYSGVKYLDMTDEHVSFEGRFGGVVMRCFIPVKAITTIHAKGNPMMGIIFDNEEFPEAPPPETKPAEKKPNHLKVVK